MSAKPFTPMRVLVTGDRNWTSEHTVMVAMLALTPGSTVIHGAARGADSIASKLAQRYGYAVEPYAAEWDKYGSAAGPIRNKRMLDEGKPTEVWAFHDDLQCSKGTRDMVMQALKIGLKITVFCSDGSSKVLGVLA
jgi:YspA, cpYpsA-related SLOG family